MHTSEPLTLRFSTDSCPQSALMADFCTRAATSPEWNHGPAPLSFQHSGQSPFAPQTSPEPSLYQINPFVRRRSCGHPEHNHDAGSPSHRSSFHPSRKGAAPWAPPSKSESPNGLSARPATARPLMVARARIKPAETDAGSPRASWDSREGRWR
ncbi:hypothetical protein L227DRAFT_130869 [Lentinus tigrinus ALCF2SS1-6]|uniref:Uncharacterized protein n=1 Tax=Lentinus tigrinus ALCF2SS1-6 TaxID=1328759 RepID=A0A5C2SQW3_9APHY|nr:hypothetical protein L227DRAFT_130869 [Lentinus tigrinus ALCF2SS1-6]